MHNFFFSQIPYAAFSKLALGYGNIFSMKLGSSWCVVVNDSKSVKEVLITKGAHFDGRPDLKRFEFLFGGDKENCKHFSAFRFRRILIFYFSMYYIQATDMPCSLCILIF